MSTITAGYIPDPSEANHHNGHHEKNGKGIFELSRKTDPETLLLLRSREDALKDDKLNSSAKAFICFAIDRALHPDKYREFEKGVTCVADSIVAKVFNVTARTVYNWRHAEGVEKYVWFSKTRRPDKWAMMVYHLTALHPAPVKKVEWTDPAGGSYAAGSKARKPEPDPEAAARGRAVRNARLAVKRAQQILALQGGLAVVTGNFVGGQLPENPVLQGISADSQNNFRPTAETDFGGQPKNFSADSRNGFRRTAEKDFGGEPKKISAVSRKTLRRPAETDCRHKETEIESERGKESPKAVNRLGNRFEGGLAGKNPESEREFVAYCQELFRTAKTSEGKPEWATNGGLWVTCFRQNKRKAWAVMHELKTMKTERPQTIKKTLGAAAMDLWKNNRVGA